MAGGRSSKSQQHVIGELINRILWQDVVAVSCKKMPEQDVTAGVKTVSHSKMSRQDVKERGL